ncbi:WhiB family transcriptional regulator [Streptomyces sp. NRRL S-350]|uniref:WhiB family transcriptional regulator n=1 Tax=Streptomyces sp. NRRL S-350 TaxID=1463902 RepID=UPI0007C55C0F|nr:WhiB family transcriptional regulator [Streptomyces sp. NRRL S-350]
MSRRNKYAPDNLPRPAHWSEKAVCRDSEYPDLFFGDTAADIQEAKAECSVCPVSLRCLAGALERGERHGVWGGMSEPERRALVKRRPDAAQWAAAVADGRPYIPPVTEEAEQDDGEDQADGDDDEEGARALATAAAA